MARFAPHVFERLNGLFAVYKPPGKGTAIPKLEHQILSDLNSMKQQELVKKVVFQTKKLTAEATKNANIIPLEERVVLRDDWFYHPAVQGPAYTKNDIILTECNPLDEFSSGVQIYGIGEKGKVLIDRLEDYKSPCCYDIHGELGKATHTCDEDGKVIDKSTFEHVHRASIRHALNMIVGRYRPTQYYSSHIDVSTQYAYEMACKGIFRPMRETSTIIYDANLLDLSKPNFRIELLCVNENSDILKAIVHEIGIELKTSAICTKIRRKRQFVFEAMHPSTLLLSEIKTEDICKSIETHKESIQKLLQNKPPHFITIPSDKVNREDTEYTAQLI